VWAEALYFREGSEVAWLGQFGMRGPKETSGWLREAVGRVRERQEGLASPGWLAAMRCLSELSKIRKIGMSLSISSLQALEDKDERGQLQCMMTRERGGCWTSQWYGLLGFQMNLKYLGNRYGEEFMHDAFLDFSG
jgi:hypothetical protein